MRVHRIRDRATIVSYTEAGTVTSLPDDPWHVSRKRQGRRREAIRVVLVSNNKSTNRSGNAC